MSASTHVARNFSRIAVAVAVTLGLAFATLAADPSALPEPMKSAPVNTWVKLKDTKAPRRQAPLFFYAPLLGQFVHSAGATRAKRPQVYSSYDTQHFDLAKLEWTNAYPEGLGQGRPASGPIPDFSLTQTGRNALLFKDGEALRISNRWMFGQWAQVPEAGKLYVYVNNQMAVYDIKSRQWAEVTAMPHDGGARWATLCYDPVNNEILQIGGHGAPFGTWLFDLNTRKWRRLESGSAALKALHTKAKGLRWLAVELLGRTANRFTVAETDAEAEKDLKAVAAKLADMLEGLSRETQSAEITPREKPAAAHAAGLLTSAAAKYRQFADRLAGKINPDLLGRLRARRVQVEQAECALSPEPTPRGLSSAAYDPKRKQIVVFGGDAHDRVLSDTWVYECATRTWQQRFPKLAPPPRAGHLLRWLAGANTVLLAGGYSRRDLKPDQWTYDPAENVWRLLKVFPAGSAPSADRMGYPLAGDVAPGDVLVALEPRGTGVYACRVDAAKPDEAGAAKLGVAPGTFTFHAMDPAEWEKVAKPDPARIEKFLAAVPKNQWTAFDFAKYAPGARNRWGTTAYDRDRHQFLFWGGGHATSMEDDVAHFSIRGGCWTVSYPPDAPLNRGSYMSWAGVTFQHRPAMPNWHAYQAYAHDPSGRMFYLDRAYDLTAREWLPTAYEGLQHGSFNRSSVKWTPHGVVCYSAKGFYRFDAEAGRWVKPTWKGPHLKKVFCDSTGMSYDSTRDCLWLGDDGIIRYDFKSGKAQRVPVKPPKFMNIYGQCTLLRESVHIPGDDLILIWMQWRTPDGKVRQIAWDPKTSKYYWADLPWIAKGKPVDPPNLHWHAGMVWDPEYKLIFMNDSRTRHVWALRFDRASAKLTEIKPEEPAKRL